MQRFLGYVVRYIRRLCRSAASFVHHHMWSISTVLFLVAGGFFVLGVFFVWAATLDIPALDTFDERIVQQSTKIYDRTGEVLLFDVHEGFQRTVVPYDEINRHLKNATVAIEDEEFYEHRGVKPTAFLRAIWVNLLSLGFEQGGSTITQQVVKNALLTQEKLISRKLKEWVLAVRIEQVLSKEEILNIYLNENPYGGLIYGVEEASQSYFGKSSSDVTLTEAAYLAALPQAPTYYWNNREALEERKNLVLERMLRNNFITEDEYKTALTEEVAFQPQPEVRIKAPHFVFYVIEQLEEKYGRRALEEGGLRVVTSLDYDLQQRAEEIVREHVSSNIENFNARNAAMVAVDPNTGEILVMVGSRDYFDEEIDGQFNVALAERQPGSSFKPFVYATAFKEGYTDETVVFDLSTQFSTTCSPTDPSNTNPCYRPVNYDGVFRGPVTFRNALAQSINIPAVKVLYLTGLDDSLQTARDLGITTLTNKDQYGLTLVLGGGEVTPLEMASAYGVFATNGVRNDHVAITHVEDKEGNTLEEYEPQPQRVLDNKIATLITDILTDNAARTPAFGESSYLHFPGQDVAAKTGTTNNYRDAWIVGYTPNIAVASWAGNNNNESMERRVAGFIVAPMWNEFMQYALSQRPVERFENPAPRSDRLSGLKPILRGIWQGGESFVVDSVSGKQATENTPTRAREEVIVTDVHSILHWLDKNNPLGPAPTNPSEDPQYTHWELPVRSWAAAQGVLESEEITIPTEFDDIHTSDSGFELNVRGIDDEESVFNNEEFLVRVEVDGQYDITSVMMYGNGRFIQEDTNNPFTFSFTPEDLGVTEGELTLRFVAEDETLQNAEQIITLFVN